jgi:phenylacetate-coenzyme A ligase PaaK-like adenylate-forming protein
MVRLRGVSLHPTQIMAAVARVPPIKRAQAVVAHQDGRDVLIMRVELLPDQQETDVREAIKGYIHALTHVSVDEVQIMPIGSFDDRTPLVKDER